MKKFYLFAASILFAASASAQVASTNRASVKFTSAPSAPYQIISNEYVPSSTQNVDKFGPIGYYIDYVAYNLDDGIMPNGEVLAGGRFVIDKNAAQADSLITSAIVNLQPYTGFGDYDDVVGTLQFVNATDPGATIVVDSIFFSFGHQNQSGNENKININLRTGSTVNFPSVGSFTAGNGSIYWKDSIVTSTSLSPSGSAFGTGSTVDYVSEVGYVHSLSNGNLVIQVIPEVNTADGDTFGLSALFYQGFNDPVIFNSLGTQSQSPTSIYLFPLNWNIWSYVTFSSEASAEQLEANGFTLHSLMPNPANIETNINFELATNAEVRFDVIDMNGRLVKSVNLGNQAAGKTAYTLNTSDLATGIYNVVMRANNSVFTKKLSVVR